MHEGELAEQMAAEIQAAGKLRPQATSYAFVELDRIECLNTCLGTYMHVAKVNR